MSDIPADLDLREQIARMDQMHADIQLKLTQVALAQRQTELTAQDTAKRAQDVRFGPWQFLATTIGASIGATAALFGAALALLKWIGG